MIPNVVGPMARRSGSAWLGLTPAYRRRLIRTLGDGDVGRARSAYLRGESLKSARGKPDTESQLRRQRGVARGLSPTQAAGHPRKDEDRASAISRTFSSVPVMDGTGPAAGTRLVDIVPRDAGQASRLGRRRDRAASLPAHTKLRDLG